MEFGEKIAQITTEAKTKQIINLIFSEKTLKFKCQRCAVFCCKLGGPRLTREDVERLEQAGYNPYVFLDVEQKGLKSREDGSCIFLSATSKEGVYQCSVYDQRPVLCRLYPFQFERLGPGSFALELIPCCNGLNAEDGEIVDERFFIEVLQESFDLMASDTV